MFLCKKKTLINFAQNNVSDSYKYVLRFKYGCSIKYKKLNGVATAYNIYVQINCVLVGQMEVLRTSAVEFIIVCRYIYNIPEVFRYFKEKCNKRCCFEFVSKAQACNQYCMYFLSLFCCTLFLKKVTPNIAFTLKFS